MSIVHVLYNDTQYMGDRLSKIGCCIVSNFYASMFFNVRFLLYRLQKARSWKTTSHPNGKILGTNCQHVKKILRSLSFGRLLSIFAVKYETKEFFFKAGIVSQ